MSRSTQKFINELLDRIKYDLDLAGRPAASRYFNSVLGAAFKNKGFSLSYYKDNRIEITSDNENYIEVPYEYLWMQYTFITKNNLTPALKTAGAL